MAERRGTRTGLLLCAAAVVVIGCYFVLLPRDLPTVLEVLIQFTGIALAGAGLGALLGRGGGEG